MGNAFEVPHILHGFNVALDPHWTPVMSIVGTTFDDEANFEIVHFARHFGTKWYFCRRLQQMNIMEE